MTLANIAAQVEETAFAEVIKTSFWLFPSFETLHVFALALVFGSIAMVDVRVLGLAGRNLPVRRLATELLPWTWIGFAVAVITGLLMFISNAERYSENLPFLLKMGLIALAGLNMVAFHLLAWRSVNDWGNGQSPLVAKLFCGASLIFWVSIITLGRWIGFV